MKIMVVDDSATMRAMERNILKKHNVDPVLEAGSEAEALAVIDGDELPDLILLDWYMPDTDGLTLAKKFKEHEKAKDIPIIMVTSEASKMKIMEALKVGVSNYVLKPFTDEDLWGKIEKIAAKHGIDTA
ncbi:PleD family two-component system response regulator [Planctomycetota bacterium]